jgi:hypothetical protein
MWKNKIKRVTIVEVSPKRERELSDTYYDAFLEYGFHYVTDEDGIQKTVCLICQKVMSNKSMKHTNLKRHIHKMQASEADKGIEYNKSRLLANVVENTKNDKLKETSYRLNYRIAKAGKIYAYWSKRYSYTTVLCS